MSSSPPAGPSGHGPQRPVAPTAPPGTPPGPPGTPPAPPPGAEAGAPRRSGSPNTRLRIALAAAVAAIIVVVVLVTQSGGGGSHPSAPKPSTRLAPVAITLAQLQALPSQLGHAVYWVGPAAGRTYELTRFSDGGDWLRYLPRGVAVGASPNSYATVGTYPVADAMALVRQGARRPGASSVPLPGGGLAVAPAAHPQSVYVGYPGSKVLIELYTPSAARSLKLVRSGKLRTVP